MLYLRVVLRIAGMQSNGLQITISQQVRSDRDVGLREWGVLQSAVKIDSCDNVPKSHFVSTKNMKRTGMLSIAGVHILKCGRKTAGTGVGSGRRGGSGRGNCVSVRSVGVLRSIGDRDLAVVLQINGGAINDVLAVGESERAWLHEALRLRGGGGVSLNRLHVGYIGGLKSKQRSRLLLRRRNRTDLACLLISNAAFRI